MMMDSHLGQPACGFNVSDTAALLRRYQFIERSCMPILAAWILQAPSYEDKYTLGYHLWDHAEHVQVLRNRLTELRGGNVDADVPPALQRVMEEARHGQSIQEVASGLYLGLKRALVRAYKWHIEMADASANAVEVRLLRRLRDNLETHIAWAETVIAREGVGPDVNDQWRSYLCHMLDLAGGVDGMGEPPRREVLRPHTHTLPRPTKITFDDRILRSPLAPYEQREGLSHDDNIKEQFAVFFNEFWAAGLLATVLIDARDTSFPWDFYYDVSHHCWDEIRHSEFGAIRLKELGLVPSRADMTLFDEAQSWPILHRLTYIALDLEPFFMKRKRPRVQRYQEAGDMRSLVFADADWSDEINHVRYGKRWVDFLLQDDIRTVDDIKDEIKNLIARQRGASAVPF
jgi:bacterioferritin (cytochrome b1)